MSPLTVILLVLVALGALAVVTTREPGRQALLVSLYGLVLAILYVVLEAPDVALSQLVIGAVGLPILILVAMAKVRSSE
jgi:uncharacterized MnhB-related membrane protein